MSGDADMHDKTPLYHLRKEMQAELEAAADNLEETLATLKRALDRPDRGRVLQTATTEVELAADGLGATLARVRAYAEGRADESG